MRMRVVEALGIQVIPVPELPKKALIVEGHDIVLIRDGLTWRDQARIADWVLDQALCHRN